MKRVQLAYGGAVTISDAAFEQIAAIVEANKVCDTCDRPYTKERPNVSLNKCLCCFLTFHKNNPLTYVGLLHEGQYHSVLAFWT